MCLGIRGIIPTSQFKELRLWDVSMSAKTTEWVYGRTEMATWGCRLQSQCSLTSFCTRASRKWWRLAPSSQLPQEAPSGHLCLQQVLGTLRETRPSPSQGSPGLIAEGVWSLNRLLEHSVISDVRVAHTHTKQATNTSRCATYNFRFLLPSGIEGRVGEFGLSSNLRQRTFMFIFDV